MLHELEFESVLTLIALEAKSVPGKAAVARRRPSGSLAEAERAQSELAEMVAFCHREGLLPLAGLIDVGSLMHRETVLELEESWQIVRAVRATQAIRETLLRTDAHPRLTEIAQAIPDLSAVITASGKYFTRDGKLREEASAELRTIRKHVHAKRASIQRLLNDVMNRAGEAIQEQLIVLRGDRYCIPVRSDHRNSVPGILHERSGSGASFFIEPLQTVELNNDLADLLIQEREEIARITKFVSQLLFDAAEEIKAGVAIGGELDALQACALFSDACGATRPQLSADRTLHIIEGRHPLLDERLADARAAAFGEQPSGRTIVPVTVRLGDDSSALIVSGPNAGGKTIALKTIGLLVALGMSGLPVPASEGTILPAVDTIHVLIGDDQSVLEHLSTFSAYLMRLKRVLERATKRSLVLLDELGSGTDPEEGAALAAATVEHLLKIGSLVVVTTHLSSLKTFAVDDTRIVNASMEFDIASGQPTYRLIVGIPGRSRAIDVAKMLGLPASLIASARTRLGDKHGTTDQLLAELQRKMSEAVASEAQLTRLRIEADRERKTMNERSAELERERTRVGAAFREELERLRNDVSKQVAAEIEHLRQLDRAARSNVPAREVVQNVTRSIEKAMEFLSVEQREIHVGERAEHRMFKVTGDVVSVDGSKVVLSVNGRKMTVDVKDLAPVAGPARAAKSLRAASARSGPSADDAVTISAELNLIGQRVDDALDESDKFLDRALLEGRQAVRIIHGFGTGKLRKAIREHLRKHPAVKSWRPGGENEGGDGATIAVMEG